MTSRVASYGARFAGVVFRREAECQDLPHRARRRRGAGRRPAWRNRWLRRHRPACDVVIGVLRRMEYRGGATTVVIAEEADGTVRPYTDYLIEIPAVSMLFQPLLSTILLQVFAASLAAAQGHDADKPRNLARSVTVEQPGTSRPCFRQRYAGIPDDSQRGALQEARVPRV
jgi:hypothetical protein